MSLWVAGIEVIQPDWHQLPVEDDVLMYFSVQESTCLTMWNGGRLQTV